MNDQKPPLNLGAVGAFLAFLAVLLGAFGAHQLESLLTPERMETFETAARYHLLHAIALVAVAQFPFRVQFPGGLLLVAGVLIFSGSLYLLSVTGFTLLGAVAPIGGLCMMLGWVWIGIRLLQGDRA